MLPDAPSPPHEPTPGGDKSLAEALPAVYEELRRMAAGYLRGERTGHTLQPTALVHEAYLRLTDQRRVCWENRAQFLGIAAQMMRRILSDYAAQRAAAKRGGGEAKLALDEALDLWDRHEVNLTAVDQALRDLEQFDPRQGRIVEMRVFGGLTVEEVAQVLAVSPATVKREWAVARLWLQRELTGPP